MLAPWGIIALVDKGNNVSGKGCWPLYLRTQTIDRLTSHDSPNLTHLCIIGTCASSFMLIGMLYLVVIPHFSLI